ncbi:hypothetical protein [Maribacter thermophilus]|uniref:hypothetical protein n=1 Tax=Maribacter thermophilus TaxID=1197874 RepID=UPI0006411646|nr:hypothetical protein [Maribacter thermophilus]
MKYYILLFAFFSFIQSQAQSLKTKGITVTMPNYANQVAPKDVETYWAELVLGTGEVMNFSNDEFKKELQLEGFRKIKGDEAPDIFVAVSGISVDVLDVKGTIAPADDKTYTIDILPKERASVKLLFYYNEELTQFWEIPILPKADVRGTKIPTTISFPVKEKEKYLDLEGDPVVPDISAYTIKKYLDIKLGENFLKKVTGTIKDIYDNHMAKEYQSFYYIKDKKNKALTNETEEQLNNLVSLCDASFSSIKDLRANKQQINAHLDYWKGLLSDYVSPDKKIKKIKWGILMNLYNLSIMTEDFNNAQSYLKKALELDIKSAATKGAKNNLLQQYGGYLENYREDTGERKFSNGYVKHLSAQILKAL